jgi:hypothetical protein
MTDYTALHIACETKNKNSVAILPLFQELLFDFIMIRRAHLGLLNSARLTLKIRLASPPFGSILEVGAV